ncbi:MAG: hypothetical protein Q9Q40_09285 [Acidobacteriota bacterium]|nr:hypothetical protein [Acidobacteriota bacterium]
MSGVSRIGILAVLVMALAGVAVADTTTHVATFTCPSGIPLWLWVEGDDFTCSELVPGEYKCVDLALEDSASATCTRGCEKVVIGTLAGCYHGTGSPNILEPNFSVFCDNGKEFDLKGVKGDTCTQINSGTTENPKITGGECSQTGKDGQKRTSTSVDCNLGCGPTVVPADCKQRS